METNLIHILNSLDLDESDIEDILETCPGLDIVDTQRVVKNISLVIEYGYPESDINSLILINPTFLVENPVNLAKKLSLINGNIESALRNNPFLI